MTKIQIYSSTGNRSETMDFPKDRIIKPNVNLMSQTIHVFEDRSHIGTSKVKTRSEVNATGAKMYKQKGTGNARHGDRKAPIFKGGGVAHGPKGIKRILKLSDNLRSRALNMALTAKFNESKVVVIDKPESLKKTKDAQKLINGISKDLGTKRIPNILFALSDSKKEVFRVFRNIRDISLESWSNLNAYKVSMSNFLMIDKDALSKNGPAGNSSNRFRIGQKGIKNLGDKPVSLNSKIKDSVKTKKNKKTQIKAKMMIKRKIQNKTVKKVKKGK